MNNPSFIIVSEQPRHQILFENLSNSFIGDWHFIKNKADFNLQFIKEISPKYIFIPHYSHKIPDEITTRFDCVMFHMTDLPFGRGGSPLQNLIIRGFTKTKLSAFKCVDELDAGPIYCKADLSLIGTAEMIFKEADKLVIKLIFEIIQKKLKATEQSGKAILFQRRTPEQGNIKTINKLNSIYDHIRMLDAQGYPNAFVDIENFKLNFSNARFENGELIAEVVFKEISHDK